MREALVIYTANANNYDFIREIPSCLGGLAFVCFTNDTKRGYGHWKGWELRPFPNKHSDPTRMCRHLKINPHIYFPEYRYSLWIDSSVQLLDPVASILNSLLSNHVKLATFKHPFRNCVYEEGKLCMTLQRDDPEVISKYLLLLESENYPRGNGLFETGVLFREHKDPKVIKTTMLWNEIVEKFSKRDQLSLSYAIWKTGLPVTVLEGSARGYNNSFRLGRHRSRGFRNVLAYIDAYSYRNPLYSSISQLIAMINRRWGKF